MYYKSFGQMPGMMDPAALVEMGAAAAAAAAEEEEKKDIAKASLGMPLMIGGALLLWFLMKK